MVCVKYVSRDVGSGEGGPQIIVVDARESSRKIEKDGAAFVVVVEGFEGGEGDV